MRERIGIILICILVIGISIPQIGFINQVRANQGDVILSFDLSGQENPWGVAWDGQYLWTTNVGSEGKVKINKITTSGTIVDSYQSPSWIPIGIEWDGQCLWHSDTWIAKIYKLTYSIEIINSYDIPSGMATGLAWDGDYIWFIFAPTSNGTIQICKMDPSDGSIIYCFDSIFRESYCGLAWDGEYLWMSVRDENFRFGIKGKIYKITTSGNIVDSFDSPGWDPYGLAWDGQYLWHIDGWKKKIYKIDVSDSSDSDLIGEISGGFGLKTSINNYGTETQYNVSWSIDVEPSIGLILSGSHTKGIIAEFETGESITIQANNLRGIGLITISVQAADAEKQATAFLLGPLVLRVVDL
jgi:hypothetical protein